MSKRLSDAEIFGYWFAILLFLVLAVCLKIKLIKATNNPVNIDSPTTIVEHDTIIKIITDTVYLTRYRDREIKEESNTTIDTSTPNIPVVNHEDTHDAKVNHLN